MIKYKNLREKRRARIKAKIRGTTKCPRLVVFRSNKYIYGQIIDDEKAVTLASASSFGAKSRVAGKAFGDARQKSKVDIAGEVGEMIAKKATDLSITKVVFDRAGYKYHGQVKALADGARKKGLKF